MAMYFHIYHTNAYHLMVLNQFSLLDILPKFHYVSQEPPISHFLQHDATPKIYSAIFGGSIIHYKICSRSAFWFESQASCGQIFN